MQLCAAYTFLTLCISLPLVGSHPNRYSLRNRPSIFLQLLPLLASAIVTYDIFYRESTWFSHDHSEGIIGPSWSQHYNVNSSKWPLMHFLTYSVFRSLFILNFRSLALMVGIGPKLKVFRKSVCIIFISLISVS